MKIQMANEIVRILWKRGKLNHIKFSWKNLKRGYGYYVMHKDRSEEIVMSIPITLLNSKKKFTDALLHEIAHALVGPYNGHNEIWRRMASRIGCSGTRCYPDSVKLPKGKYRYQCPKCKYIMNFYRKPIWEGKVKPSCGNCCDKHNNGRYSKQYIIRKI